MSSPRHLASLPGSSLWMWLLVLMLLPALSSMARQRGRSISRVAPITVATPPGTVPRLPHRVWVTHSDGTTQWRQVRWECAATDAEQQLADSTLHPAGTHYTVLGHILGDQTTPMGYPVQALVTVEQGSWAAPPAAPRATPLALTDVHLTGTNRLTSNCDMLIRQLLSLDVTQQLYNYRLTYGLPTQGYTPADGWDSPHTKLRGHGTGHYMSALAFAYAATQDTVLRRQLYQRMDRVVSELQQCQLRTQYYDEHLGRYRQAHDYTPEDSLAPQDGSWATMDAQCRQYEHYGYGYLNAIPPLHCTLVEHYVPYNNETGVWAPYYTVHKQLAGLIDIATVLRQAASPQERQTALYAFLVARDMGLWVWDRMYHCTHVQSQGDQAQRRARPGNRYEMWNMYIAGEVGGMAESLARLSLMEPDSTRASRLLWAAQAFDAPALFDPLSRGVDDLRTRHANQHIPMFVGALSTYEAGGGERYYQLALNAWSLIQGRYAYATGGVGNGEMWRQPYTQMLAMNTNVSGDGEGHLLPNPDLNETCCVYNLLKLTRQLNAYEPDNAALMDYYEQALYNQLVGSVRADQYGVCYQYAVGMAACKPFGNETPQSSCCGGTGSENHTRYHEAAYYANDSTLWVALYLPTQGSFTRGDLHATLSQQCAWPAQHSTIRLTTDRPMALRLRVPYWATQGFDIRLNGHSLARHYAPSSYVHIPARVWSTADSVTVDMPYTTHIHWGPDRMDVAATGPDRTSTPFTPQWVGALMYGPLVMATPDVRQWEQADFRLSPQLDEIKPLVTPSGDGTGGPLYALSLRPQDRRRPPITLWPDYYVTDTVTHYLRLDIPTTTSSARGDQSGVERSGVEQLLALARQRQQDQEVWQRQRTHVPEYAPWAPHGYRHMLQAMEQATAVLQLSDRHLSPDALQQTATALSLALNTMRPGNLAEPQDLSPLQELLSQARAVEQPTPQLTQAIAHAQMVIHYVNDGSGTPDMIAVARQRLHEAMPSPEP